MNVYKVLRGNSFFPQYVVATSFDIKDGYAVFNGPSDFTPIAFLSEVKEIYKVGSTPRGFEALPVVREDNPLDAPEFRESEVLQTPPSLPGEGVCETKVYPEFASYGSEEVPF
jgi:hypothetical protein